jgi:hypothetical protein
MALFIFEQTFNRGFEPAVKTDSPLAKSGDYFLYLLIEYTSLSCYNYLVNIYIGGIGIVKHIILWKLKAEHNTADVKKGIKTGLEGLMGVIPGLVEIKVETETLASSNVDVMLYSVFCD